MEIRKFTTDVNKETYLAVKLFPSLFFVKNKKRAPIVGNRIKDERIGKSIILLLKRLIKLKSPTT